MTTVGVIGASGFIGSRIVELFHFRQSTHPVAIIRDLSRLPVLARMNVEWRVANSLDRFGLTAALDGCDAAVLATSGSVGLIEREPDIVYRAADDAGVRRLIVLSTAVVHGQDPLGGTDESTPLRLNHELPYNNSKARAEFQFQRLRRQGRVELVILRPCIVFGPRDRWVCRFAREMRDGHAYLVNGGNGICNTTYVDNLVDAVEKCLDRSKSIDGESFLIVDDEEITWRELYDHISEHLFGKTQYEVLRDPPIDYTTVDLVEQLRWSKSYWAIKSHLRPEWRRTAREVAESFQRALAARRAPETSRWSFGPHERRVPWEMAALHRCSWKFPTMKAKSLLDWQPAVSVPEGLNRTLRWLEQIDFDPDWKSLEEFSKRHWEKSEKPRRPSLVL